MDALLLSRIQFGFTIGFHILFPTLTIGLAWFLVYFEAAWLRTQRDAFLSLYRFWVLIFALTFGMGVVSGLVLSYEVGTNFSRFSEFAGPVLGPLLSAEVLTAFFVEAGFLGIMLFGWEKVGRGLHFAATLLVAVGTTNSAFWILAANSFMQTPQGAAVVDGRLVPLDWIAVIFNPSFPYRLAHMLLAAILTSSLVVAAASAWHVLRGPRRGEGRAAADTGEFGERGLKAALAVLAVAAPLQIFAGDQHGLEVQRMQPMKVAAMEALWHTRSGAPLVLFAWPDQAAQENRYALEIPQLASVILKHDAAGVVRGLDEVAPRDQPPVIPVFFAFRAMVGIGFLMLALGLCGAWLWIRGRLLSARRYLRVLVWCFPLGFVATISGWIVAETGRQPWLVYGLLRTADGASPVIPAAVATSLAMFVVVYGVLFGAYVHFTLALARKGPVPLKPPARHPEAMRGVRAAEVLPEDV
jgi:cytochrome bd ubiquinol oxidase subunit I